MLASSERNMRLDFDWVFHVADSEIVRSMIQKQSYGFKMFVATTIGEIQPQDWWWF